VRALAAGAQHTNRAGSVRRCWQHQRQAQTGRSEGSSSSGALQNGIRRAGRAWAGRLAPQITGPRWAQIAPGQGGSKRVDAAAVAKQAARRRSGIGSLAAPGRTHSWPQGLLARRGQAPPRKGKRDHFGRLLTPAGASAGHIAADVTARQQQQGIRLRGWPSRPWRSGFGNGQRPAASETGAEHPAERRRLVTRRAGLQPRAGSSHALRAVHAPGPRGIGRQGPQAGVWPAPLHKSEGPGLRAPGPRAPAWAGASGPADPAQGRQGRLAEP